MTKSYIIAHANIARMTVPLDDPKMASFLDQLDVINAVADESPGFVWRWVDEADGGTNTRLSDDEGVLLNMSVWESIEELKQYAYQTRHSDVLRDRGKWFNPPDRPHLVLWWIPAGTLPTVEDACVKFEYLWEHGPTLQAFTFRDAFPSPHAGGSD